MLSHVHRMKSIFNRQLLLEIQHHDFDGQRQLNISTVRVAYETGTPLTATGDPTIRSRIGAT